jgi:glyoxylase-like metal-dependent hydrolase (beta-lactamase superfamily II)
MQVTRWRGEWLSRSFTSFLVDCVLVKLDGGTSVIFPGDVIPLEENLTLKVPSSNNWDSHQAMESIYRIEHLACLLDAEVVPSHDISKWEGLTKSPQAVR